MNGGLIGFMSNLEKMELRLGLKCRIQWLGKCNPKRFSGVKDSISRCARLYARLCGIDPHNNSKLIIAQSLGLKPDWRTNYNHSWKKEMKKC